MTPDLVSAEYVDGFRLRLVFEDGLSGVVDCLPFIRKGGIYAPLSDPAYFATFKVNHELGVLSWDAKIDIAPETLYSLATGVALPQWMDERPPLRESA